MLGLDSKDISPSICYFILNIDRYDELLSRCMMIPSIVIECHQT